MKILITTGIFEPEIGGPAEYAPKLATGLVAHGHAVKIVTYSKELSYDFDKEYPFALERVVRAESNSAIANKLSNYTRFFWAVLRESHQYDLIYSLDWFTAGLPVSLAARLAGKKYLLRIGGGYIWEKYLNDGNPPITLRDFYAQKKYRSYPLMYAIMRFVLQGAYAIIFNTNIQREFYAPHYGLRPQKLTTIFNPVPSTLFSVERGEPQKEIIFAGRMTEKNNVKNALLAFVALNTAGALTDHTLTFIGDGFLTETMKMLAQGLGLTDVIFLPAMRQKELYERIKNCRYVILPSWTDISPNTAYECLALGIPFLLTTENYLSIRDQLPFMIDPRSVKDIAKKMRLLANETAYKEYCAKLRAIEFKHDWNDVCEKHIEIFSRCMVHNETQQKSSLNESRIDVVSEAK